MRERFGSALAWQSAQHAGGKLIYLVRIPVLARLLPPEDFGVMAIAIIAVETLMNLTNLGFVPALVQSDEAEERHFVTAWSAGLLRAAGVSATVALAAPWIADAFGDARAAGVIQLLALRPLLQAAGSIQVARATRDLEFRGPTTLALSEAVVNAGASIALASSLGVWALAAGSIAGAVAQTALSYWIAPWRPRFAVDRAASQGLLAFGRWIFALGIVALAGRTVLHAVISRRLGADELGLYFLAARIAFLPSEIAHDLVGAAAFPLHARLQSDLADARRAVRATIVALGALLVPLIALLIVLAPLLVSALLGPRWDGSTPVVRVLAVACLAGLLADVAGPVLKGLGAAPRVLGLEAAQSLVLIPCVWVLTAHAGLTGAAASWIPASLAGAAVGFTGLRKRLGPGTAPVRPLAAIAIAACAGAAASAGVASVSDGVLGLAAAAGAGLVTAWGGLAVAERTLGLEIVDSVTRLLPALAARGKAERGVEPIDSAGGKT